jgi:hypothetical protein
VAPIKHAHWSKLRGWIEVDALIVQDIVDGATNVKWETKTHPFVGAVLKIDIRDSGWVYAAEWDAEESTLLQVWAYPPWMVVEVQSVVNP